MVELPPGRELETLRQVMRITHAAMRSYGVTLNYKPGKPTAMFAFHGEGSTTLRQHAHGRGELRGDAAGLEAPLAIAYKHLGTMVSADGSLVRAVALRVSKHRSARAPLGRTLKRCQRIPADRRLLHLDALATTHLHYCAETWPGLPPRLQRRLSGARIMGYRMSLGYGNHQDCKTTDDEVLVAARLPCGTY